MKNYFFILVGLLLFSCQKDSEILPFSPTEKEILLTQQIDNQKVMLSVEYNTENKVERLTEFGIDVVRSEMIYDKGRLVRQNDFYPNGSSAGYKVFFYDFYQRLNRLEHYKPNLFDYTKITLHHYETFEYNAEHQLTKSAYYHTHGDEKDMTIDNYSLYEYEPNGNLKTERIYAHRLGTQGDMILAVTGSFAFDEQPNPMPLNGRNVPNRHNVSPNNMTKATYRYPNGNVYDSFSFEAKYQYHAHGFPQSAELIFTDGTKIERKWEYKQAQK